MSSEILLVVSVLSEEHSWLDYPGLELWKFVNLLAFSLVMFFLLRRPLTDAFRSRREAIRRELRRAREERDEALAKLAEVDSRLALLDSEVESIQRQSREEALNEAARIAQETEAEMSKLREQAQREIESATKVAKQELRWFAAQQSVKLAEEIIRRDIRPEDDAGLVRWAVSQLGRDRN
jgi:F0F1-type ATP synthase membrane subunit b/b'